MRRRRIIRRLFLGSIVIGLIIVALIVHRVMRNPVLHDHGARQYALWREGLNPNFPKQKINGFLNEDIDRDSLVRGLTLPQVQQKFYDVRTKDRWTPYQAWCLTNYPPPAGTESVFLSDDWWGVQFKDGRATGFFLTKGC